MAKTALRFLLACFFLVIANSVFAAPANIAIVLSDESAPYQETANSVRAALDQAAARVAVTLYSLTLAEKKLDLSRDRPDLIVAVGARAAQEMAARNLSIPILSTLIPRQFFEKLAGHRDFRQFSAVYLDQPLARQIELIRLALPEKTRIGVVMGPESLDNLKALQAVVKEAKFGLALEKISASEELLPTLQRVLADSDVLLALPDPLVFNKGTVQSLLLTTYRYQDPVIGFSQAYVKAGALAAVYSTPEQIGRHAGEVLVRALAGRALILPSPEYPKYFSVSVNYQVARSLGLSVGDEALIYQKLKHMADME